MKLKIAFLYVVLIANSFGFASIRKNDTELIFDGKIAEVHFVRSGIPYEKSRSNFLKIESEGRLICDYVAGETQDIQWDGKMSFIDFGDGIYCAIILRVQFDGEDPSVKKSVVLFNSHRCFFVKDSISDNEKLLRTSLIEIIKNAIPRLNKDNLDEVFKKLND